MDSTELLAAAQVAVVARVAEPGDWLTGAQRVAVWAEVRDAATNPLDRARREALSPNAVAGTHGPRSGLSAAAVEVVHRVASDPGRLTQTWAREAMAGLAPPDGPAEVGEAVYTELVGVTAICAVVDRYALALGAGEGPLPAPVPGEPARARPDDVGEVGAWVAQTVAKTRANVSRSLSLVPVTNDAWRLLVDSHYSRGAEFYSLTWDRPLTRPQVELVAARTTSLHECFY